MAHTGEPYPENYFPRSRDIESLARILSDKRPAGIEWTLKRYEGESHHSMPQLALYDGLSFVFRGYRPTLNELYNEPQKLRQRYEQLSARLGEKVMLREDLLNFFGYQFLSRFKEPEKAITYFELNAQYYPGSANVWDSLGEAYDAQGDELRSARMYEKSLSLNPGNEKARKRLQGIRGR